MQRKPQFIYMHESHLDLFWLGNYHICLERGNHILKQYIDRCVLYEDETFLIETVVFLKHFLKTYPDYIETVKRLWSRGQLEIGCGYVDVWQNLVLGESHIANLAEGRKWLEQELGIDSHLAAHPDLPGLSPQTPQIYSRSGVRYYATSRKIFPDGAVWNYAAPDGSEILVLNHPRQYIFNPLEGDEVSKDRTQFVRIERTLQGFPLQKVILSGGTGDLADMRNFKRRMGRDLRETLTDYKYQYPHIAFSFGTISAVLREYEEVKAELPQRCGEIPSVWGIDESAAFFHKSRVLEGALLVAGFMEALGALYGLERFERKEDEPWFGIYHEFAFFREKDLIPYGDELPSLWRMHLFTQDHNGGGQEGALSSFQKRTLQDRAVSYAGQIIHHYLKNLTARVKNRDRLMLVNPLNMDRYEPIVVELPKEWEYGDDFAIIRPDGERVPWQVVRQEDDREAGVKIAVACPLQGGSYSVLKIEHGPIEQTKPAACASCDDSYISVESAYFSVKVNRRTGALESIRDLRTGTDWGSPTVNRLYAVRETGNDTTLRVDEAAIMDADRVLSVEITSSGPMFVDITIRKSILHACVEQQITVWLQELHLIDIATTIWWHGMHNVQLRQCLPSAEGRESVAYGTPFYGSGWMNVARDSGPCAIDEISREDYPFYREVQMWLHQRNGSGTLALATRHPTFHWGQSGLEALLLRTPKSCGDPRFYWENSGKQQFHFRLKPGLASDSTGWADALGQQLLCPILSSSAPDVVEEAGEALPAEDTFIAIEADNLILSSVRSERDGIVLRVFEASGCPTTTRVSVKGMNRCRKMSLDGEELEELAVNGQSCSLQVKPFEIVTLSASLQ